jgi:hypothetical protein
MAITSLEGYGKMSCSGRSTKGTGASRSGTGGGGERAGVRWEEMASRLLSVRIPRANPRNMFRRYRNLDVREKTRWNIVDCRVEFESSKCEVYIRCAMVGRGIYTTMLSGWLQSGRLARESSLLLWANRRCAARVRITQGMMHRL